MQENSYLFCEIVWYVQIKELFGLHKTLGMFLYSNCGLSPLKYKLLFLLFVCLYCGVSFCPLNFIFRYLSVEMRKKNYSFIRKMDYGNLDTEFYATFETTN